MLYNPYLLRSTRAVALIRQLQASSNNPDVLSRTSVPIDSKAQVHRNVLSAVEAPDICPFREDPALAIEAPN